MTMKLSLVVKIHEDLPGVPKLDDGEHIIDNLRVEALKHWLDREITMIAAESELTQSTVIGACACFLPDDMPGELDKAIAFLTLAAGRHQWHTARFPKPDKNGYPPLAAAYVWKPWKPSHAG